MKLLFSLLLTITMNMVNLHGQVSTPNDPYWEFVKTEHFRPKLNRGNFFKLTGLKFQTLILDPIYDYLQDRNGELTRGKHLSFGQKALYYWLGIDGQVSNGGFTQFYFNDYGKYVPTIIKSLQHIGDNRMADLVTRSYDLYLKEHGKIDDARLGGLEGFSNLYKEIENFDDLDTEFYSIKDKTNRNIENFIRKNPNEICLDEEGREFDLNFTGELNTIYKNNTLKERIPLVNGIVSGVFTSYYENEAIKEEIHFYIGELTGDRVEYYENGNKKYSCRKDSLKNRIEHLWFYLNGNPKKLEYWQLDKDERIGEYKEWHDNGTIASQGTYLSGYERVGQWLEFHKDGSKKIEAEFKDNTFLIHNCWNEKGEQILMNGTGLYIDEHSSSEGVVERKEEEYRNYARHGKQQLFKNGKLSLYQEMAEGKSHGFTKSFDKDGNLIYEIVYEYGRIMSRKTFQKK